MPGYCMRPTKTRPISAETCCCYGITVQRQLPTIGKMRFFRRFKTVILKPLILVLVSLANISKPNFKPTARSITPIGNDRRLKEVITSWLNCLARSTTRIMVFQLGSLLEWSDSVRREIWAGSIIWIFSENTQLYLPQTPHKVVCSVFGYPPLVGASVIWNNSFLSIGTDHSKS